MAKVSPRRSRSEAGAGDARGAVMARVARRARRFPDLFPEPLEVAGLGPRDRALAYAVDQAVTRRWLTLAAVARAHLSRPWQRLEPPVQAALLAGAAQLLLLERLPDHAVINESVQWIKQRSPRAAGLVNAVLHRIAETAPAGGPDEGPSRPEDLSRSDLPLHDGRVLRLARPAFAEDPLRRLAEQTSHAPDLVRRWSQRYGFAQAAALCAHDLVQPPVIVAGFGDAPPEACLPHEEPGFAVFGGDRAELEVLLRRRRDVRVQDPGSAAAVAVTAGLRPRLIVEVCAGRGTKTRQLLALHPEAEIVAADRNPARVETLRAALAGRERVEVVEYDRLIDFAGRADLVVVDPPCTNTAVLARRLEARYRFGPAALQALLGVQRQVVADSLRLLGGAGRLLYSTCSLEPQENEQQMEWALRWHGLRRRQEATRMPRGRPGQPPRHYADGSFAALLERR